MKIIFIIVNLFLIRINELDVIQQLCTNAPINLKKTITYSRSESIYKTMKRMNPPINNTIENALYAFLPRNFQPIFTERGICYTFNSLNSREILTDEYE